MFLLYHHFLRLKSLRGSHPFLQPSHNWRCVESCRAAEGGWTSGRPRCHQSAPSLLPSGAEKRLRFSVAKSNALLFCLRKTKLCMKFIIQMHCFSQIDLETILQCLPTWEAHQPGGFWLRSCFKVTGKTAGSTATPNFNCFIKNKYLWVPVKCWMEKSHLNPRSKGWVCQSGFQWIFPKKHWTSWSSRIETARRWSPTSSFQTFLRAMKVKTSKPPGAAALCFVALGLTSMWVFNNVSHFYHPWLGMVKLPPIYCLCIYIYIYIFIYLYIYIYGDLGDGFVTFFYPHLNAFFWHSRRAQKKTGKDPAAIPVVAPSVLLND